MKLDSFLVGMATAYPTLQISGLPEKVLEWQSYDLRKLMLSILVAFISQVLFEGWKQVLLPFLKKRYGNTKSRKKGVRNAEGRN